MAAPGRPPRRRFQRDAMTLFDQVYATHPHIAVVGRSLGSGVAVRLASQRPAARLVLITPYNSLEELAARQFPWFPVKWLLKDSYESWKYAAHITVPTLLIAAEHDEVIPRSSTERLYTHFANGRGDAAGHTGYRAQFDIRQSRVPQGAGRWFVSVGVRLAQRSERRAKFLGKKLRLFPGREVAALVGLVEVDQVAIGAPGPCFWRTVDILWKHGDGHRQRDLGGLLCGRRKRASPHVLPVEPGCRSGAIRQPVRA